MPHPADGDVPLVSVLIVNYNGRPYLDACLESVRRCVPQPHEVVVCDNGSRDDSVAYLRRAYPDVRVIVSPSNDGFASGNNQAAAAARGELLFLLNNDTILHEPLDAWIAHLRQDSRCGVLGPRLVFGYGLLQESVGIRETWWRLWTHWLPAPGRFGWAQALRLTRPRTHPVYDAREADVDWVSGAALLTPRALWERLGGMDAGFFMYLEDTDYCRRVREAGYRVRYSADATITHLEGGGKAWGGAAALERTLRSSRRFAAKHFGALSAAALRVVLPVALSVRAVAYAALALKGGATAGTRAEQARAYASAAGRVLSGQLWSVAR